MKRALVLFLSLIFCVVSAAQDLPDQVRVDKLLLEATKALENDDLSTAYDKFQEIEQIFMVNRKYDLEQLEAPPELLFHHGKFLVEQSFGLVEGETLLSGGSDAHLRHLYMGQSMLKQLVSSIDRGSEYYKPALELLLVAEDKVSERQRQMDEYEKAMQQAALKPMGEMVSIPGGTFQMGDLSGKGHDDEKPVHTVTVRPFKLGKYEVTFAQWDACMADGGCKTLDEDHRPDDEVWGRGNLPVIDVSWDDAQLFIDWLSSKTDGGYRLPTEAEWEYAARAGSLDDYSWGDDVGVNQANCDGCGSQWDDKQTAPAGSFPANAWGLHDMHGNVAEWVQDCWHENYEGAPSDGSAWTSSCQVGDDNEDYNHETGFRVCRGGSWYGNTWNLYSASRTFYPRWDRLSGVGFRLAKDE